MIVEVWSVVAWALLELSFYFLVGTTAAIVMVILIVRYTDWRENICSFPRVFSYICLATGLALHILGNVYYFAYGNTYVCVVSNLVILGFLCFSSICKVVYYVMARSP